MKAHTKALVVASSLLLPPSFHAAGPVDGPLVDCGACEVKTSGQSVGEDVWGNKVSILVSASHPGQCEAEGEQPCKQTTGCTVDMAAKTVGADGDPVSATLTLGSAEVGYGRSSPSNSSEAWTEENVTTGTFGNKELRAGQAGCNKFSSVTCSPF